MNTEKEILLKEIEELLAYGTSTTTIEPALMHYLSLDELHTIKINLLKKVGILKEEDKKWLEQFKDYS